jgi:hypothetical protein
MQLATAAGALIGPFQAHATSASAGAVGMQHSSQRLRNGR